MAANKYDLVITSSYTTNIAKYNTSLILLMHYLVIMITHCSLPSKTLHAKGKIITYSLSSNFEHHKSNSQ